ncbi:MAG: hypothetical protein AB1715_06325, partial [Acidobacteriota bacterium]
MKTWRTYKLLLSAFLVSFLIIVSASAIFLPLAAGERTTTPAPPEESITVVSFYPSVGTVKDWVTLRENGLIVIPSLRVLGVYHEKELTDY